jgi:hypothetical protein
MEPDMGHRRESQFPQIPVASDDGDLVANRGVPQGVESGDIEHPQRAFSPLASEMVPDLTGRDREYRGPKPLRAHEFLQ